MSNPFSKLFDAIKFVAIHVGHAFVALIGKEKAEEFGKAALEILKTEAGKIVMTIVANMNTTTLTSREKRDQAFDQIKGQFVESRIEAKDSAINLMIELAVQALKGVVKL